MEYVGLLAPIAFVFSLAALSQAGALKKEVDALKEELQMKKTSKDEEHGKQT